MLDASTVNDSSTAGLTRRYLAQLEAQGFEGRLAAALFRALKASARAKHYRGRSAGGNGPRFRDLAYMRKQEALNVIGALLLAHRPEWSHPWGWGKDTEQSLYSHVLYIDIPEGQVSFHSPVRGMGPTYPGVWDGVAHASVERILAYCDRLMTERNPLGLFARPSSEEGTICYRTTSRTLP